MASQPNQMSDAAAANRRAHLKEVTSEPPADSVGTLLRETRMKLELEILDATKFTKIKPEYLEALEEGRLDVLPGRTYAIGFLRSYAEFLKLDAAACVARLKAEYPAEQVSEMPANAGLPEIETEVRLPQGALIVIGIVLLGLIYAGVYLFRSANQFMEQRAQPTASAPVEPLAPAPQSLVPSPGAMPQEDGGQSALTPSSETQSAGANPELAPAEPVAVTEPASQEPVTPAVVAAAKPTPVGPSSASQGNEEERAAAEPPTPIMPSGSSQATGPAGSAPAASEASRKTYEEALAGAPRAFGIAGKDNRVVLRANNQVFVRIESAGARDQVLFEGTLNKDELYYVPKMANVVLVTRNGGALDLFVDGIPKGTAGPAGIALKDLPLNPDVLKAR